MLEMLYQACALPDESNKFSLGCCMACAWREVLHQPQHPSVMMSLMLNKICKGLKALDLSVAGEVLPHHN